MSITDIFNKSKKAINSGLNVVGQTIEKTEDKVNRHFQLEGLKSEYSKSAVSLADMLVEIGKLPGGFSEEVVNKYDELLELYKEIKEREKFEMKARGKVTCYSCNNIMPKGNQFCSVCGAKNYSEDNISAAFKDESGMNVKKHIILKGGTIYMNVEFVDINGETEIIRVLDEQGNVIEIEFKNIKEIT